MNGKQILPDKLIKETKNFINEMSNVQEKYFEELCEKLELNEQGRDWLFDYIHNSGDEGKHITFQEYISFYGISLDSLNINR